MGAIQPCTGWEQRREFMLTPKPGQQNFIRSSMLVLSTNKWCHFIDNVPEGKKWWKKTLDLLCESIWNMNCQEQDEMQEQMLWWYAENSFLWNWLLALVFGYTLMQSGCVRIYNPITQLSLLYNRQIELTNGDCYTVDYLQVYRISQVLSIAAPLEFLPLDAIWTFDPALNGSSHARGVSHAKLKCLNSLQLWSWPSIIHCNLYNPWCHAFGAKRQEDWSIWALCSILLTHAIRHGEGVYGIVRFPECNAPYVTVV
jgi:hypothetical protein